MNYYRLFGITLASEIEFANLLSLAQPTTPDYTLKEGSVTASSQLAPIGIFTQASVSELYHEIPGVVRFHCKDNIITIDKKTTATTQDIKTFLLDTIFAYLLNQQGYLILKGSAVKIGTEALLITSNSSNGTSALAATLQQEFSYPIISDGLLVISSHPTLKTAQLIPNQTPLTLWQDSCRHLTWNYDQQITVRPNLLKYEFPLSLPTSETLAIKNLIHLAAHNADTIHYQTLHATDKIDRILELAHYPQLIKVTNNTRDSFKLAVQLANNCNILKITRPNKYDYPLFTREVHAQLITNSLIPAGASDE